MFHADRPGWAYMAAERTAGTGVRIDNRQTVVPADGLITTVATGGNAVAAVITKILQEPGE
ncbi:MAG: hypothetical protein WCG31_10145, partial [Deltaproteobacteria bacterium]